MSEMFNKYILNLLLVILFFPCTLFAEDADELYRQGKYADAEDAYKQGDMDNPKDFRYRYNRGCAAYRNSDQKGAAASFSSVYSRAKGQNKELAFRSSYNLGNIAFSKQDYSSAAQFYKMALAEKPDSIDAKYNLELSLLKLKESKKNKENDKQCDMNNKDNQNKDGRENQDKQGQNKDQNKQDQQNQQNEQAKGQDREESQKEGEKQDLTGELSGANPMDEKMSEEEKQAQAAAMLDKKKAEALLDNIKEDPAKILQYQTPKDKRDVDSGKAW